jgi:hypothetical protein
MPRLNCFADVADWYNRTPVLRSKFGREHDIRPLDRRDRKWRIAKLDDNTYVVFDGHTYGDPAFPAYAYGTSCAPTREDAEHFAAVVWKRHADGTETLKVRGASYPNAKPHSRIPVLNIALPWWATVHTPNRDGNHVLRINRSTAETSALPRDTVLTPSRAIPDAVHAACMASKIWIAERTVPASQDEPATVFRRHPDGKWELVSERRGPRKWRVDKERKAELAADIRAFWEWGSIMLPMLLPMYASVRGCPNTPLADADESARILLNNDADTALVREILTTPDHPMRVELLLLMVYKAEGWSWATVASDVLISKGKKQLDRRLGLYRKMEVKE